ncbi:MAG: hypothetical protein M1438_03335 [Deltaproteobacteria bacterium]|nr:hypothetical protein [Deltaproteobacteria bacterium]
MTTVYYEESIADEDDECIVRIEDGKIGISYDHEDDGNVIYKGKEEANGHFELKCESPKGQATLHRFPEGLLLEGSWVEEGFKGFWQIKLRD